MRRCGWLVLLGCVGCQSLAVPTQNAARPSGVAGAEHRVPSGEPKGPSSGPDHPSPSQGPGQPSAGDRAHMQQAATSLREGHEAEAATHLERYVTQRPEHLIARAQLGELLFRQEKMDEARLHFELFIALSQEYGDEAFPYLVHSHSRLVEIAEAQEDEYQEHLNRGIGLYLLASRRTTESDPEGEFSAGSLFCRAAGELQEARAEQPEEARPQLYLYQTWSRLGQRAAARRALEAADAHALFSRLTPLERRELGAACIQELEVPGPAARR